MDDHLADIHQDKAFTLRLSNYFPRQANATPAPRCGEHKDFGTFTVLFQACPCLCFFHRPSTCDLVSPDIADIKEGAHRQRAQPSRSAHVRKFCEP